MPIDEEEPVEGADMLGCMADEPVEVEPDPDAVGRSVEPEGWVCAKAGAAKAVATRQAAICFFSIDSSPEVQ
ncbi:hypothetical protein MAE02_23600 [Microvirga aerophila]|uniref:Uncharacterized protein n=1 Tax=Microvirga aerophila TaxID=670291 RepID=A0A512BRZ0_9HYPH|nr:hypothetical protein MAE02_23600 [Microvirga aerophila]